MGNWRRNDSLTESTAVTVGIAAPSSAEDKSVTLGTQPERQSTKSTSSIGSPWVFPKSEASWKTEFFTKHASAAIERRLAYQRFEFIDHLYKNISRTESPLEASFVACLMALPELMDWEAITWRCQHEVEVDGRGYRLDIVFEASEFSGPFTSITGPLCPLIALELDGHEFHEKTKEQVTHRNRRDRDLQSAGWTVLHVSGSEFNRDPQRVTQEIYDRVSALFWAAYHAHCKTA
jgi:hypothetical protein